MLCRYAKVKAVYALKISEKGAEALRKGKIFFEFEEIVPAILNKKKDGICPFEKLVLNLEDEMESYKKIKEFLKSLLQKNLMGFKYLYTNKFRTTSFFKFPE